MPESLLSNRSLAAFSSTFPAAPTTLARAPGRVELLGNHTDHNEGLVIAAAIDRESVVVGRASADPDALAQVFSVNLDQLDTFHPAHPDRLNSGEWSRYVRGVVWALGEAFGPSARGFEAALTGNVPLGAGLSSSASLQAAFALFLLEIGQVPGRSAQLDDDSRMALAKTLRRSENEFVGVASGLLDQFSSLFGRAGHALMLDCRTLEYERVSLGNPAPAIVVCDSMTSRRLADGMYNRRRAECESIVSFYRERKPSGTVNALRDVTLEELQNDWLTLDPVGRRRARHVLTENERVRRGAEALRSGDSATFGGLMSRSHASSRDDFENSSPALDALIESAQSAPGFLGGKLSGAGWAGCSVNLVANGEAEAFAEAVRTGYAKRMNMIAEIHVCHAAEGASARRL